jgi:hypothetical protein
MQIIRINGSLELLKNVIGKSYYTGFETKTKFHRMILSHFLYQRVGKKEEKS